MTVIVSGVRSSTSASVSSGALTRLHMTQPTSARPSPPETYADRQSAHNRSRLMKVLPMLEHFGCEPVDERVDVHIAFGLVASPRVHADGAVVDVGVAHDEDVRDLLGLGAPDTRPELARRTVDQLRAEAFG